MVFFGQSFGSIEVHELVPHFIFCQICSFSHLVKKVLPNLFGLIFGLDWRHFVIRVHIISKVSLCKHIDVLIDRCGLRFGLRFGRLHHDRIYFFVQDYGLAIQIVLNLLGCELERDWLSLRHRIWNVVIYRFWEKFTERVEGFDYVFWRCEWLDLISWSCESRYWTHRVSLHFNISTTLLIFFSLPTISINCSASSR